MNITRTKVSGFDLVTLTGEFLTEPEQFQFRAVVKEMLDGGARHLIVNLGEIRHVNSCGLGSMICALVMTKNSGGDLRFIGVNRGVGTILEMTHLDRVLPIYPDLGEATAAGLPA